MKNTLLQIVGFVVMVLGAQDVIRLLVDSNAGFLSKFNVETSLAIGISVVIALSGVSLLTWSQKQTKKV